MEELMEQQDEKSRPPIFDERNRVIWEAVRRMMLVLLKELDRWYGWNSFKQDTNHRNIIRP